MADKVSIIGAGAVGATLAQRILENGLADVVLVDIARDMAIGKAFDLSDASPIVGHEQTITGTDDYSQIKSSKIVVVTAGLARKPGMTREDLISKNAGIVKGVCEKIKQYAPDSIVVVVTNPLDAMTYLAYKTTGFKRERVFGMAGELDGARFIYLLAEKLKVPRSSIRTYMLGSHGDTMVPVLSKTTVSGKPLSACIAKNELDAIVRRTRDRGAEIVKFLTLGSAYYSPSAAAFKMVKNILTNTRETVVASACLDGEYGLKNIAIGVPCKIGKGGIEEIIKLDLSKEEDVAFRKSAEAIESSIEIST